MTPVAAAVLCAGLVAGCRGASERVDLLARFESAQKGPDPAAFALVEADLAGERHRAIGITPMEGTRVSWRMTIPRGAWLWVSIGMPTAAWTAEGDGVKFSASVVDGGTVVPLFEQHLHPYASAGDRKWFPIRASLRKFEGREVEIVLSTAASPDGSGADIRNDLALWGVPEIVTR